MNIKDTLKAIKMNESVISMVIGIIVVLGVGILVARYFRSMNTTDGPGSVTDTSVQDETGTSNEEGFYIVEEGETLWDIAEAQYGSGYNWTDIAETNNLENPGQIETGQRLTIPEVEEKVATVEGANIEEEQETSSAEQASQQTDEPITGATYTVERGDYLWDIAVRAYGDGYRWVDIARENELANPDLIHAGNVLTIPR